MAADLEHNTTASLSREAQRNQSTPRSKVSRANCTFVLPASIVQVARATVLLPLPSPPIVCCQACSISLIRWHDVRWHDIRWHDMRFGHRCTGAAYATPFGTFQDLLQPRVMAVMPFGRRPKQQQLLPYSIWGSVLLPASSSNKLR